MRTDPRPFTRHALAAAVLLAAPSAWSQDEPVRRALISQATQARDRGDHVQALALAREAAVLRMSTSLRTFLAQEYAATGQSDFALSHARTCVGEVEANPNLPNAAALLAECRAIVDRLAPPPPPPPPPTPPPPPPPPRAERSPSPLPPPVAPTPAPERPRVSTPPVGERPRDPAPEAPRVRGPGAGPWVVVGLGVVSFGAAGFFYALRDDALVERDVRCAGRSPCELPTQLAVHDALAAQDRAGTYNLLTNVAIGVGGAAVTAGLLWFFLGRRAANEIPTAALAVSPRGGGVSLGVHGAF